MAGDREHEVVVLGVHRVDHRAERFPELDQRRDLGRVGAVGRGDDAPAVVEQRGEAGVGPAVLGAGDRVRGDHAVAGQRLRRARG